MFAALETTNETSMVVPLRFDPWNPGYCGRRRSTVRDKKKYQWIRDCCFY